MSSKKPDLSIVIVNYRCWEKLHDCLTSLVDTTVPLSLQVIVVDNDSADGKLAKFSEQHPSVEFISNSGNYGFASGCNAGAAVANADQLLFLNPDTLAGPGSLLELLHIKQQHPDIGMLSCKQVDGNGNNQRAFGDFQSFWTTFGITRAIVQRLLPEKYPSARRELTELTNCDWISGSVVMISREHFDQLGGWDDSFWMYSEDVDLSLRTQQQGLRVCYEPSVTITHLHGGASRGSKVTKAITKSEVIISKHFFASKHGSSALAKCGSHALVIIQRVVPIALAAALSSPTALFGKPTVSFMKAQHLLNFYRHWLRSGDALSLRIEPAR